MSRTREEIEAAVKANKKLLKQWWKEQPVAYREGHPVLLMFGSHTAYFAELYRRRAFGRLRTVRRFCSVDLTHPLFNSTGRLRIRALQERFAP